MVDLIQSKSICQIDLIRIGTIWIGMAAREKSNAPAPGETSPVLRREPAFDSAALNAYNNGWFIAIFSRFDRGLEKSEAWPRIWAFPGRIGGNEDLPLATKLSARNQIEGKI